MKKHYSSLDYIKAYNQKKANNTTITDTEKKEKMATLLSKPNGFIRLAAAQVGDVIIRLKFEGCLRNWLKEDVLQPGDPYPQYNVLDQYGRAYQMNSSEGQVRITPFEGKIVRPVYTRLAAFPQVKEEDLEDLKVDALEFAIDESTQAIQRAEDALGYTLLEGALVSEAPYLPFTNQYTVAGQYLTPAVLAQVAANIRKLQLKATTIIASEQAYTSFELLSLNEGGIGLKDRVIDGVPVTQFMNYQIFTSILLPDNTSYILPDKEFIGKLSIKKPLEIVEDNYPRQFKKSAVMSERISPNILNARGLAKITTAYNGI
jgi:hypothetical protein